MTSPLNIPSWTPRTADRIMLVLVLLNGLAALVLGTAQGQALTAAAWAGGMIATAGVLVWRRSGAPSARLGLAAALGGLAVMQQTFGGDPSLVQLNVHVSLGVLLLYRDWRPLLAMGAMSAAHLTGLSAWLPLLFLAAHTAVMCVIAIQQHQQDRAAGELEFLVKTMGREGKILLNLDVIRAETPIGQRLQHVQQRMLEALGAVRDAAQRVDLAAQRVASGSSELMSRTEATANGLREAVLSLDQINVIVQHSTEASAEAKRMSGTAAGIADRGGRMVSDVVKTMQDIQSSSQRINDIVGVIDGIAFQTNILALNAAVEAARAGEHGRGFAVVANEVRALASRSAAAAKEIRGLISTSTSTVQAGAQQVAGAGATMNELVASVSRVGQLFDEVTADTAVHMESLAMVSQSMSELDGITRQNVELADQTDQAAADLQALASRLADVLGAFHLPALPAGAETPAPVSRPSMPQRRLPAASPPAESSAAPVATFF